MSVRRLAPKDLQPGSFAFTAENRAWAERILTSVSVEKHAPQRPEEIVLHSPPRPLMH